jgi:hypothetical protein
MIIYQDRHGTNMQTGSCESSRGVCCLQELTAGETEPIRVGAAYQLAELARANANDGNDDGAPVAAAAVRNTPFILPF